MQRRDRGERGGGGGGDEKDEGGRGEVTRATLLLCMYLVVVYIYGRSVPLPT
jgi:hypothetical protein